MQKRRNGFDAEFEALERLIGIVDDAQFAEHRHRVLEVCEIQLRDQLNVNALKLQVLIARLVLIHRLIPFLIQTPKEFNVKVASAIAVAREGRQ
ncbi:MAG: hypothetical protein AW09_000987 [Candidatus Accumulibacter phosphatis]|uniref:Uncharacterized protein n=1 Tax=Candidatus Accumulibacter phosphatis TaxID=327160 RepID=A0A080LY69_9PROT|nr:MAG: hypothetical protein AW09_000987 [Candidatus Accumulibacter phosphatis]